MRRFLSAAAFFVLLALLWQWLFELKIWSPVLLPSPLQVAAYLKSAVEDATLGHATVTTMRRLLTGYLFGIIVGLPLGLLTARWTLLRDTLGITALGLQTLPSVCWVPL